MTDERTPTIFYRWVERTRDFTPYGGDFETPEEAIEWGSIKVRFGNFSPEMLEIFLIQIETQSDGSKKADVWRREPSDLPTKIGDNLQES